MKKLLIIISLCCYITGCEKRPLDVRNKYLGEYSFTVQRSSYVPVEGLQETTYLYDDQIVYGTEKNCIMIPFYTYDFQVYVYEDGTLEGYYNNNGRGEFLSTRELQFSWGNASPASHISYQLKATKK